MPQGIISRPIHNMICIKTKLYKLKTTPSRHTNCELTHVKVVFYGSVFNNLSLTRSEKVTVTSILIYQVEPLASPKRYPSRHHILGLRILPWCHLLLEPLRGITYWNALFNHEAVWSNARSLLTYVSQPRHPMWRFCLRIHPLSLYRSPCSLGSKNCLAHSLSCGLFFLEEDTWCFVVLRLALSLSRI